MEKWKKLEEEFSEYCSNPLTLDLKGLRRIIKNLKSISTNTVNFEPIRDDLYQISRISIDPYFKPILLEHGVHQLLRSLFEKFKSRELRRPCVFSISQLSMNCKHQQE